MMPAAARASLAALIADFRGREKSLFGDFDEGFTCGLYFAADKLSAILTEHTPAPMEPDRELEVLSALLQCADTGAALEKMTDEQIGNLLIEHAWPHFDMLSPLSDLVSEAADRLKGDVKCHPCDGTGRVFNDCTYAKCGACDGAGTVREERKP